MPTVTGNYLIEVDGVSLCLAQECEIGGVKLDPFELYLGTRGNPIVGRGKWKVEEVKIKQAVALNNEGQEFAAMFQDYIRGVNITKPTIRIVTLGEDGFSPVAEDEFVECVPTSFVPDAKKAEGKDPAHFSIAFRPTDHIPIY